MMEYLLSLLQDLLKVFVILAKNVKEPPYAVGSKREVLEKENNFI
ncbi:hypothetical protein [Bacillus cereus]|nr:hypothetical protein [Bacillus cereus]